MPIQRQTQRHFMVDPTVGAGRTCLSDNYRRPECSGAASSSVASNHHGNSRPVDPIGRVLGLHIQVFKQ
jgi:hypothetical protein